MKAKILIALVFASCLVISGCGSSGGGGSLVADINKVVSQSFPPAAEVLDGVVYFTGFGENGYEVYRLNGTTAVVLSDIRSGVDSSDPANLTVIGSKLYFHASNDDGVRSLYVSDGTEGGTVELPIIYNNEQGASGGTIYGMDGRVYFGAKTSVSGNELWTSDGTREGTVLVKDINPAGDGIGTDPGSSEAGAMFGGKFYFNGYDGTGGVLWESNGTAGGTVVVDTGGAVLTGPRAMRVAGNYLYLCFDQGLYSYNGTAFTKLDTESDLITDPANFTVMGDSLYFTGQLSGSGFYELLVSSGSVATTRKITELSYEYGDKPEHLTTVGTRLFFWASVGDVSGKKLWVFDGTDISLVSDFTYPEDSSDFVFETGAVGERLYFSLDQNVAQKAAQSFDYELWVSDGTAVGTYQVKNIQADDESEEFNGSGPQEFCAVIDILYFSAFTREDGWHLWKSDGTQAGTVRATTLSNKTCDAFSSDPHDDGSHYGGSPEKEVGDKHEEGEEDEGGSQEDSHSGGGDEYLEDPNMVVAGDRIFLKATNGGDTIGKHFGKELWVSRGTAETTVLVKDILDGTTGASPRYITPLGEKVFFVPWQPPQGSCVGPNDEVWVSDGTEQGTHVVKEVNPYGNAKATRLTAYKDEVYFVAKDGFSPSSTAEFEDYQLSNFGNELHKTNGTVVGTFMVKDINPGPECGNPKSLAVAGDLLFFSAKDAEHGRELWRCDGTAEGTFMVKEIVPGTLTGSSYPPPKDLVACGDRVFFTTGYGDDIENIQFRELWVSDGTEEGTHLVKDINPGSDTSHIWEITPLGDKVYFTCCPRGSGTGRELWVSDGTEEGTRPLPVATPLEYGIQPQHLTVVGDKLFYTARVMSPDGRDGLKTHELWVTDGTAQGNYLVKDINPGLENPSSPDNLKAVGGVLFFSADDGEHGREVWVSDGTEEGTVMVRDVCPGEGSSFPYGFTEFNRNIYFIADDGIRGLELHRLFYLLEPVDTPLNGL